MTIAEFLIWIPPYGKPAPAVEDGVYFMRERIKDAIGDVLGRLVKEETTQEEKNHVVVKIILLMDRL